VRRATKLSILNASGSTRGKPFVLEHSSLLSAHRTVVCLFFRPILAAAPKGGWYCPHPLPPLAFPPTGKVLISPVSSPTFFGDTGFAHTVLKNLFAKVMSLPSKGCNRYACSFNNIEHEHVCHVCLMHFVSRFTNVEYFEARDGRGYIGPPLPPPSLLSPFPPSLSPLLSIPRFQSVYRQTRSRSNIQV
jgi:hypothetical protein